jgi:hypothetical protein
VPWTPLLYEQILARLVAALQAETQNERRYQTGHRINSCLRPVPYYPADRWPTPFDVVLIGSALKRVFTAVICIQSLAETMLADASLV